MFTGMGIQWAGTLLGCVAILLVPIPVGFLLYGRKLRERSRFSPTMRDKPPLDEELEDDDEEDEITRTGGAGVEGGGEGVRETTTTATRARTGAGVDAEVNGDVEKKMD